MLPTFTQDLFKKQVRDTSQLFLELLLTQDVSDNVASKFYIQKLRHAYRDCGEKIIIGGDFNDAGELYSDAGPTTSAPQKVVLG
jgi:hypothetical protein